MFKLKRPCLHCPFKKKCLKGWLGKKRTEQIIKSIFDKDKTFTCHVDKKQHCVGAIILMENYNDINQMTRIAERLHMYKKQEIYTDKNIKLIFRTKEDFIKHHT